MASLKTDDGALVLPDRAEPPTRPIERRHAPSGRYGKYKPCIRWDFGFSCAICLVHECELVEHGAAGSGTTSIEHRQLQKDTPDQVDVYANCIFVCRYCNGARVDRPLVDTLGRTLLDPTAVAWADHFSVQSNKLEAISGDRDAEYTQEAYRINDARRIAFRSAREQALSGAFRTLLRRAQLLALVDAGIHPDVVEELRERIRDAERIVRRFLAVPVDAPQKCACHVADACCLSQTVRDQGRAAPS